MGKNKIDIGPQGVYKLAGSVVCLSEMQTSIISLHPFDKIYIWPWE